MPAFLIPRRLGVLPRTLLLIGAAGVLGLISARVATSHYGTTAIEALIGIPALIILWPRPLLGCAVLLALLATVFPYGALPRLHLPGHPPISIADVLLAVVVGGTIWRRPWRTWHPEARRWCLAFGLLMVLVVVVSIPVAVHGHDAARSSILGLKNLLYIALALTIALELSERRWRTLLDTAIAVAAAVSVLSIAAAASGAVAHVLTNISSQAVMDISLGGPLSTTSRVRLPGLFFAYAMFIPTVVIAMTVRDRWRTLRILALLLMVGAIAVSLNRNMYFGSLIGLVVTMVVGGPRLRHRMLFAAAVVVASAVLIVESVKPAAATEVAQRATSALSSQVLSSGSAEGRRIEFRFALSSIGRHPWDGVGWLQDYGFDSAVLGQRVYVEDLYLHLATDYGIPAALAFLLVPGMLLAYGVRRARGAADPADRALVAAAIGAVVALMLSCLVGTYLQAPDSTISFGVACGLLLAAAIRAAPRGGAGAERAAEAGAAAAATR
jgi:hypothetical protein